MSHKSLSRTSRKASHPMNPPAEEGPAPPLSSLAKLLLALSAVGALVFALRIWITPIKCPDLWFHMKAGEWIFTNHTIPKGEMFAWPFLKQDWMVNAWLSDILLWAVYSAGSDAGIVLVQSALSVLAFVIISFAVWRISGKAALAVLVLLLAVVGGSYRFTTRPELFSLLFLPVMLAILYQYKFRISDRLPWLVVLGMLWPNLHFGFTAGAAVLGCFLAGEWLASISSADRQGAVPDEIVSGPRLKRLAVFSALTIAATLINPYHLRAWFFMSKLTGQLQDISEWYPLLRSDLVGPLWISGLAVLALAGLTAWMLVRSWQPSNWSSLLVAGVFGVMAWRFSRQASQFCLVAPFAIAAASRGMRAGFLTHRIPRSLQANLGAAAAFSLTAVVLVLLFGFGVPQQITRNPFGFGNEKTMASEGAVKFIKNSKLAGRKLFNSMEHGGWLVWKLWPEQNIYMDGRMDVFGLEALRNYQNIMASQMVSERLTEMQVDYCYLRFPRNQESNTAVTTLACHPDWALVFFDDSGLIYARKAAFSPEFIEKYEYKIINPTANSRMQTMDLVLLKDQVEKEARQAFEQAPDSYHANYSSGIALYFAGNTREAVKRLEMARKYGESRGSATAANIEQCIGQALLEGKEPQEAVVHFEEAYKLAGEDTQLQVAILNGLGAALSEAGKSGKAEETLKMALALDEEINATRINLGRVRLAAKHYGEAVQILQEAADRDPNALDARALLARALAGDGQSEKAVAQLEYVAQSSPPLAADALSNPEFDSLRGDPRIQALTGLR